MRKIKGVYVLSVEEWYNDLKVFKNDIVQLRRYKRIGIENLKEVENTGEKQDLNNYMEATDKLIKEYEKRVYKI